MKDYKYLLDNVIQAVYDTGFLSGRNQDGAPEHMEALAKRKLAVIALTEYVEAADSAFRLMKDDCDYAHDKLDRLAAAAFIALCGSGIEAQRGGYRDHPGTLGDDIKYLRKQRDEALTKLGQAKIELKNLRDVLAEKAAQDAASKGE